MSDNKFSKEHKTIPLEDLKEYPKNAKIHEDNIDEIIKSIEANNYIANIIVDEELVILAGHGRRKALEKMGTKEVEVTIVSGLSQKQKADYRLRDNRLSELSRWDFDIVKDEIALEGLEDVESLFDDIFSEKGEKEKKPKSEAEIAKTCKCPSCGHEFEIYNNKK